MAKSSHGSNVSFIRSLKSQQLSKECKGGDFSLGEGEEAVQRGQEKVRLIFFCEAQDVLQFPSCNIFQF